LKKLLIILISASFIFSFSNDNFKHNINNFNAAKKVLTNEIYPTGNTFYCGCKFNGKKIDIKECGYKSKGNWKLSKLNIQWEHVSAAQSWGQSFKEWRDGDPKCVTKKGKSYKGRRCAYKNAKYKSMEADLHNLEPAISEVNQRRSNYTLTEMAGEPREFGTCDIEIKSKKAEPRDSVKGNVARSLFYMQDRYGIKIISNKQQKLYDVWNLQDPVDEEEKRLNCLKAKYQGNENKYIGKCN